MTRLARIGAACAVAGAVAFTTGWGAVAPAAAVTQEGTAAGTGVAAVRPAVTVNKYWNTDPSGVSGVKAWGWQKVDSRKRDVIWGYVQDTAPRDGKTASVRFTEIYLGNGRRTVTYNAPAGGARRTLPTQWLNNPAAVYVKECNGSKCGKNWRIYSGYGGRIDRGTVLTRARYWYQKNVPYSQKGAPYRDINNGSKYRRDCSGFIAMAWGLAKEKGGVDPWTGDIVAFSHSKRVAWNALKPGDMVLRTKETPAVPAHVKLFEKWNAKHTSMLVYEEGSTATDMNHKWVPLSYLKQYGYTPYRYGNIV